MPRKLHSPVEESPGADCVDLVESFASSSSVEAAGVGDEAMS